MAIPWKIRLHEWLADRLPWVQYPHIRPLSENSRLTPRFRLQWRYKMPIWKRLDILLISLFILLLSGLLLAGFVGLAWALLFG